MSDPFDLLREELVRVAAGTKPSRSPRWLAWLRRRPRPLLMVAATIVVSGSAAAAVISLSAKRSQPLAGTVPGTPAQLRSGAAAVSLAGDQYRITVTPDLTAGDVGWCTSINYTYRGKRLRIN